MRTVITFVVVFVVAVLLMGQFGAVGPFELLLAVVLALLASLLVRRRRAHVAWPELSPKTSGAPGTGACATFLPCPRQ
jgi:hypothetical protein